MREAQRRTKGPEGNSALVQQPTHPQTSSDLPGAGTADRRLASTATQNAAAVQQPWTKPLLGNKHHLPRLCPVNQYRSVKE